MVSKYVRKGDLIYVEGKIKTREVEKDGVKRYFTEVRVDTLKMMPKGQNTGGSITPTDSIPEQNQWVAPLQVISYQMEVPLWTMICHFNILVIVLHLALINTAIV